MIARWLLLLTLVLPAPAAAETLEGSWALEIGGTAIFRFDLAKDTQGHWHGTWSKPASFASDGNAFSHLSGPARHVASMTAIEIPGGIEVSFNDPQPGAVPDIFDFTPIDPDAVELTYVGTKLAPYTLERVQPDAPLGPWDAKATYAREAPPEPPPAPPPAPPPLDPSTFKLPPGAPVGR